MEKAVKEENISALKVDLAKATSLVLADFRGISVKSDTAGTRLVQHSDKALARLRQRSLHPATGLTRADDEMRCTGPDHRECEFFQRVQADDLDRSKGTERQSGYDRIAPLGEAAGQADGEKDHALDLPLAIPPVF